MVKRKRVRGRTRRTKTSSKKLAGYTRIKGKYVFVHRKKGKLVVGKSRFSSKKSLMKAAQKYLK